MGDVKKAAGMIAGGQNFTKVMKACKLSKSELIEANNSIPGYSTISNVRISDGKVHPKGEVLAW